MWLVRCRIPKNELGELADMETLFLDEIVNPFFSLTDKALRGLPRAREAGG